MLIIPDLYLCLAVHMYNFENILSFPHLADIFDLFCYIRMNNFWYVTNYVNKIQCNIKCIFITYWNGAKTNWTEPNWKKQTRLKWAKLMKLNQTKYNLIESTKLEWIKPN